MGKMISAQRRGKGGLVYRSPSHRHLSRMTLPRDGEYTVHDVTHAPGRNSPVLVLRDGEGRKSYQIAFNGASVGQSVRSGGDNTNPGYTTALGLAFNGASVGQSVRSGGDNTNPGYTTALGLIPDGARVHNIESIPGDGGKFCRTAGSSALVVSHGDFVTLRLSSGKMKVFNPKCRATIGIVAGSGARDSPVLKAGRHVNYLRSKAKRPYTVRGVAMNAVNHPHGGGNHQHVGRPSTVGRGTPPGRKVGRLSHKRRVK
ncbi:MAG: 50S ribosomal protein L2 [Candidatus Thermoplasmatota archaeon]|nr:50S ribosomal protein L2 [Candidatus Thermoplasmatota archaeon]